MLAHSQVLDIGGFTGPSAVDSIYPRIQHAPPWQRNVFFSSVLFFVSSDVITSLSGKLDATLKKYQDRDLLNQMRSQGNIKNQLLTIFRNASPVCLYAPFQSVISGLIGVFRCIVEGRVRTFSKSCCFSIRLSCQQMSRPLSQTRTHTRRLLKLQVLERSLSSIFSMRYVYELFVLPVILI